VIIGAEQATSVRTNFGAGAAAIPYHQTRVKNRP
jgi:hypothetical protein